MQIKDTEKLVKTIEKLEHALQKEQAKVKTSKAEIKQLSRANRMIAKKLKCSQQSNISLKNELKKNCCFNCFTASNRAS
jgi:RNase P subunit RPR2